MNKQKLNKILEQYSEYLKKYGVYLLIILFILTVSLNFLLGQDKEAGVEFDPLTISVDETPITENIVEPLEIEVNDTTNNEPVQELEVVPVVTPPQEIKQESSDITNPSNEADKESRSLAHSPTRPLNFQWPVQGEVLKSYGLSYSEVYADYRLYPGIDIDINQETAIKAACEGKVTLVEKNLDENYIIEIDHGEGWLTYYANIDQALVKEGQRVKSSEKIGQGSSPLHFRVKQNEHWIDPIEHLPGKN